MLSVRSLAVLLTFTFLWAPTASAQLDLPDSPTKPADAGGAKKPSKKRRRQTGNLVKHLVCTVCYERNYTASFSSLGKDGLANVYCNVCRRPTFHKPSKGAKVGEGLDLPTGGVILPGEPVAGKPPVAAPVIETGATEAASFILAEVRKLRDLDDSLGLRAVDSLISLGEPGFEAARVALAEDEASVCLCGARVLLQSEHAADRDRVVQRLRGRLPKRVGPIILEEILKADPVYGTPQLLVELLDHPYTRIRNAAFRDLHEAMGPELFDDVSRALKSKRGTTRARAVDLLGRLDDSRTFDVLIEQLADSSAQVANNVAGLLALSAQEGAGARLLSVAFDSRWILRRSSYALLALIEREDANLSTILTMDHVEALLAGLDSSDEFVAGTCATALAGIGFRSADLLGSDWLERRVPDRMVTAVSGKVFHADFASLQPHALRRLRLITGKSFGSNGQEWVQWWVTVRDQFYPHRAHLIVVPERVGTLSIHYRSLGATVETFNLIGEDLAQAAYEAPLRPGEQVFLSKSECRDLISLLRAEGVLGADRLPGTLGTRGSGERSLEILIDGHGKAFMVGAGFGEPWFDRVVGALSAARDRGAWQRYPDPAEYADSYSLWRGDKAWWAEGHSELERGLRMKAQLKGWLSSSRITGRKPGIDAMMTLYEIEGVAQPEDFAFFRDRLQEERFYGPRAEALLGLSVQAARLASDNGLVSEELGIELANILSSTFGQSVAPEIARVIKAGGSAHIRKVSKHKHPLMRAIAASVLAGSDDPLDRTRLLEMLEDEDEDVQVAAMLALGEHKIEEGRTELLVRARFGQDKIRLAALKAIAYLGGEFVFDALLAGRSDPQPLVRAAAVEGLAILGDPRAAPLLISLLAKGRNSSTFTLAWDGLMGMGEEAHTDMLHAMYSPTNRARPAVTLLLATQLESQAASTLISLLTDAPDNRQLLFEVAVLTCVDYSGQPDASIRWWDWWDSVVHDDSLSWFRSALEREGLNPPGPETFREHGSLEGALFLVSVLGNEKPFLAERARRELALMFGHKLPVIPADRVERAEWISALRKAVLAQWEA